MRFCTVWCNGGIGVSDTGLVLYNKVLVLVLVQRRGTKYLFATVSPTHDRICSPKPEHRTLGATGIVEKEDGGE